MKDYKLQPFAGDFKIDYEKNLNPHQLEVIREAEGPCLVLAGAGSGKTRILTYRLAYLIEKNISPQNILLVTFTNKAALEMIHRSETLIKSSLPGLWAGTFHHIGNVILRKEANSLGYSPNFTIVDSDDEKSLIEDCLDELGLYKKEKMFPQKNVIANIKSLAVNSLREIDEVVAKYYTHIEEFLPYLKKILAHYKKKKKEANLMDFDDLLNNWLILLQNDEIMKKYSQIFQYILVDEYQDTNRLQFEILKRLHSIHENILVVGDDAQSIYSFRAAEINNILDFPKTFKGCRIFKLETNYRSSPQILNLANHIIKHNINQFPKNLKAVKNAAGIPVIIKTRDVYQQAKFVSQRIIELNQQNVSLNEMAVLFRSRFQALELEMELMKRNIPYIVRGGVKFFEQAHIKDVMAYFKTVVNPLDELSFKRALCLHKGIGRSWANKIWHKLTNEKKTMENIHQELSSRPKEGFREFSAILNNIQKIQEPQTALNEILAFYKDYCYVSFDNPGEKILDLEELAKMATEYPTIKSFLIDLNSYEDFKGETVISAAERQDLLVLSTIHQAKGLEWENVFIIGVNDYEFPHPKALNSEKDIEEERRLFYVAVTRAKTLLHITYPETKYTFKNGLVITRPSMFLHELPPGCYEEWSVRE